MSFGRLVKRLKANGHHNVDSRNWREHWSDNWVVYADLIAFAARSTRSKHVVVNNIVRFHRSVSEAHKEAKHARLFQFTDAAFLVTPRLQAALSFAVTTQHQCLAHNYLAIQSGKPFFDHLIIPRVTIARGATLKIDNPQTPTPDTIGVSPDKLLAGSGIVHAYTLERSSSGGLITLRTRDLRRLRRRRFTGDKFSKTILNRWTSTGSDFLSQGDVHHVPWILFNPDPKNGLQLRGDSRESVYRKLETLFRVVDICFHNYRAFREPLSVSHHITGLERHLVEILEALRGHYGTQAQSFGSPEARAYVIQRQKENMPK